jgi:hypothetical protein
MSLLPAQQQTMTTENTFAPAQALAMQQANIFRQLLESSGVIRPQTVTDVPGTGGAMALPTPPQEVFKPQTREEFFAEYETTNPMTGARGGVAGMKNRERYNTEKQTAYENYLTGLIGSRVLPPSFAPIDLTGFQPPNYG